MSMYYALSIKGIPHNEEKSRSGVPCKEWVMLPSYEDFVYEMPCGFHAQRLFFFGLSNTSDRGTGGWWSDGRDRKNNLFICDKIGEAEICYSSGEKDIVPFIMGVSAWWAKLWNSSGSWDAGVYQEPFRSDIHAKKALEESVRLGGLWNRDEDLTDPRYWLCVQVDESRLIEKIILKDNPAINGYPLVTGVTIEAENQEGNLLALNETIAKDIKNEAEKLQVTGKYFKTKEYARALDKLDSYLNTRKKDLPEHFETIIPPSFAPLHAPGIKFAGNVYADMITNIYFDNVAGMLDKVDTDGRCYCSSDICSYGGYFGFGTRSASSEKLKGDCKSHHIGSWSRDTGVVITELAELGLTDRANLAMDWNLLVSYMSNPPHWSEQGNFPENRQSFYHGEEGTVIAGQKEYGNRENDGQGLLILALYHVWLHNNKKEHWVKERYRQITDNIDWIIMQIDDPGPVRCAFRNKTVRHTPGLLYTESECSDYGNVELELYSNYACWLGLLAGVQFAQAVHDSERAEKYSKYAQSMHRAMLEHLVAEDEQWGSVWKISGSIWPAQSETMAPAILFAELFGNDHERMDPEIFRISRNTLSMLMGKEKRCDWANAMGYGQAYSIQAALYLDNREAYTGLFETAALCSYNPRHENWEWHIPEGAIMTADGEKWHRIGDLGNGVQQASLLKCIRIATGIDDTDSARLLLIPRLPKGWTSVQAADYPVIADDGEGNTVTVKTAMHYIQTDDGNSLRFSSEGVIGKMRIRLPERKGTVSVKVNDTDTICEARNAKDASGTWLWIENLTNVKKLEIFQQ